VLGPFRADPRIWLRCDVRIVPAGSVAAGLNAATVSESADLIVLGSRHRGHLGEALPGRVGHGLLRDPSRPVALVAVGEPARPLRHIGVLGGDEQIGPRAVQLAARSGARLRVYGPRRPLAGVLRARRARGRAGGRERTVPG
jgi:hypothetical protein